MAFQSVAEDVNRLRRSGVISKNDLQTALKADEARYLEEPIVPGLWYPLGAYCRLLDLLCRKEGSDRPEYLIQRGVRAAERMMSQGAYREYLSAANRWGEAAALRTSGSGAVATARAWPMLISPLNSIKRTGSGKSSNLNRLATWLRDLPTSFATLSWV